MPPQPELIAQTVQVIMHIRRPSEHPGRMRGGDHPRGRQTRKKGGMTHEKGAVRAPRNPGRQEERAPFGPPIAIRACAWRRTVLAVNGPPWPM